MKLEEYRIARGLKQEEAADAFSRFAGRRIRQGTWSKWESGQNAPDAQNLSDLAKWSGMAVTVEDFIPA